MTQVEVQATHKNLFSLPAKEIYSEEFVFEWYGIGDWAYPMIYTGDSTDIDSLLGELVADTGVSLKGKRKEVVTALLLNLINVHVYYQGERALTVFTDYHKLKKGTEYHDIFPVSGRIMGELVHQVAQSGVVQYKKGIPGHGSKLKLTEDAFSCYMEALNLNNLSAALPTPVVYKDDQGRFLTASNTTARDAKGSLITKVNELLADTDISLNGQSFGPTQKMLQRKFSNKACTENGRLWGGYWQSGIESEDRLKLLINGNPVCEVDINSTHPLIAYAMSGMDHTAFVHDAYWCELLSGGHDEQRKLGKQIVLALFNANSTDRESIVREVAGVVRDQREDNGEGRELEIQCCRYIPKKEMSERFKLEEVINSLIDRNSILFDNGWFGGESWKRLNKIESDILLEVMGHFVRRGIPVLPVHDSIVIERQYQEELIKVYQDAICKVLGREFRHRDKLVSCSLG
ncbi:hypothetical protein SAMN04487965_0409 [Microbulbifer donghaiensis]|uniref:Uncharacterized protein n=1 Tax=Microbulbifer donghaiensis TaxID=494016 RepID=A0A1M4VF42_9GAMM|nr:hypothetical protein [Microbulbifer donghaiensis]SHE67569.1 hypothetical protein SAMN04487965_0409 [Microbulbifer donghaiensis]